MSNDLNQCNFIGRLGQDPESRFLPSGEEVVNFSIAVGESWKDKQSGQKIERAEWVRVVSFGNLATICAKYLNKGSRVYISGKFKTRSWDDKNTGQKMYSTEIKLVDMQMLDSKSDSEKQATHEQGMAQANQAMSQQPQGFAELEEDPPF